MACYWNVFGEQMMNVGGNSNFTTVDRGGKVESWQYRPYYNKVTGRWSVDYNVYNEDGYDKGDWSRDGQVSLAHFDASLFLFPFAKDITLGNWKSESLATDEKIDFLREKEIGILEDVLKKNLEILNDYAFLTRLNKLHDHAVNVSLQREFIYLLKVEGKVPFFKDFSELSEGELEDIDEKFSDFIGAGDYIVFKVQGRYYFSEKGNTSVNNGTPMMEQERAFLLYRKEEEARALMAKTENGHYIQLV